MERLDTAAESDANEIIERIPLSEGDDDQRQDQLLEVIADLKKFGILVQHKHLLEAYTHLMRRANGPEGPASQAAAAIRDGVASRIGLRVAHMSQDQISPRNIMVWMGEAELEQYNLARAQTLELTKWLIKLVQGRLAGLTG